MKIAKILVVLVLALLAHTPQPINCAIENVEVHLVRQRHKAGAEVPFQHVHVRGPHDLTVHPDGLVHEPRQLGPDLHHDRRRVGRAGRLVLVASEQHAQRADLRPAVAEAYRQHVGVAGTVLAVGQVLRVGRLRRHFCGVRRGRPLGQDEGDIDVAGGGFPDFLAQTRLGLQSQHETGVGRVGDLEDDDVAGNSSPI
ncbi:uncharacterized protein PG986_010181 [Apiospora aurea]|uniref:Secreted protein n=1 Tax=Apiospora aurea TaxID=335848 RepID=A0ABR1Q9U3_9PEZI